MTTDLTAPIFTDEEAARAHFEKLRWPDGRVCPHCGTVDNSTLMQGKSHRPGLYKCKDCRKPFTATMGTVFERSHIPLHKWLLATHLLCASKKGISAHQLWRMLGFGSYRTAWFMAHRIREAMKPDDSEGPLGGEGKVIEADETYFNKHEIETGEATFHSGEGWKDAPTQTVQKKVVSLVERGGHARSFKVDRVDGKTIGKILAENADPKSTLMTDEFVSYRRPGRQFTEHHTVNHSAGEYARGPAHTNSIEGYFSVFKRGMKGVYQHCGKQHLQRYLTEFDFRYSNRSALKVSDAERAEKAIKGAAGKRLTYKKPRSRQEAAT